MSSHHSTPQADQSGHNLFHDQAIGQEPTTPYTVDIVREIQSATSQLGARLDGFNLRLGDMERHHRLREEQLASPSPSTRTLPASNQLPPSTTQQQLAMGSPQDELPPASITINRGATRARPDAPIPPHMTRTAAALASSTVAAPTRTESTSASSSPLTPLARYKAMTKGEKSNTRRALAGLGLSVPVLMQMLANSGEDDDVGSTTGTGDEEVPPSSMPDTPHQTIGDQSASAGTQPITSAPAVVPDITPTATVTTNIPATTTTTPSPSAVAITPMPGIDPAPNITAAANSLATLAVSTRPMTCKTEWIGEFNGEPSLLENFLTRIRDLLRSETQPELIPAWHKAVFRTLPRTFTKDAAIWHQGLSNAEAQRMTTFDAWCEAMRAAFPVNMNQLRKDARNRKWKPSEETSVAYYFHKVCLLRQAYGEEQAEDSLVTDIKDGLPESIIALLRLPRKGATLAELRLELGDWEPNWRVQYKVPLRPLTSTSTPTEASTLTATYSPAVSRVLQTTMGRSASVPATPAATNSKLPLAAPLRTAPSGQTTPRPMSKFAAAYDPTRISPAQNGQPRRYRPPGKDTVMDLKAPCSYCGGDHFNFEHDHIVPQVRTMVPDDDDYEEYPWDGDIEEDGEGGHDEHPSLSTESGIAPSMFTSDTPKSKTTTTSRADDNHQNETPGLFFADKSIFSITRTLRPNEAAPPLAQEKRAFGKVVTLPRQTATGTGQGFRSHVPLTTHVRVNDTDGRAMSTLLDTGASLSCIDASLLRKMGGSPTGSPMTVHGIGSSQTLGWITLPLFISAQDPHGKHVNLEFDQDFHVLPSFPPGLCLGLDFIANHGVSISPVRGRGRIGRYTFQVHERLDKPYAAEIELRTTTDIVIAPQTQAWVQVNAACLAPGVDYTVAPRLSVTPDQSICLTGPNGLLNHGQVRHILLGNYGDESFHLEQDTIVADAAAARVGDLAQAAEQSVFTLDPRPLSSPVAEPPSTRVSSVDEPGMPFDPFEEECPTVPSLTHDASTTMVDDVFRVGVDDSGHTCPELVELLRQHRS
ncbi:hypothetical protein CF326_g8422, partial [Tilletia indica]